MLLGPSSRVTLPRNGIVLALPAMACSLALGVFQLGEPSIWIDEAYTAERADRGWSYGDLRVDLMWLYYVLVKTWALVAGTSEFALRLPSVVGAVIAVGLLYGLARKMFGERVAFVASLLLALNPFVVKWSQQARAYTFLLVLVIASTWLLFARSSRIRPWLGPSTGPFSYS